MSNFLFAAILAMMIIVSLIFAAGEAAVVEYNWTLRPRRAQMKDTSLSPDCALNKPLLLVDDLNPGPSIRANVGDTVRVTLINKSPNEAASLHFHGLTMLNQPYADGVSMGSQCALGPNQRQVYEFTALSAGTHYWHGHLSMEIADGVQGPIIISDPYNVDEKELATMYDEEIIVSLQDWYHLPGQVRRTGLDTNPFIWIGNAQTFLINGGGIFSECLSVGGDACAADCSADNYIKTIDVEAGKTYRLRIISAAELIGVNFAIAGHNMTVVEVEGTIVEPFEIQNLDIMPGQRYSVLVTMDQPPDIYWATTGVRYRNAGPPGYLAFRYTGAEGDSLNFPPDTSDHPDWETTQPTEALEQQLFSKTVVPNDSAEILNSNPESIRRIIVVGTQAKTLDGQLRWTANNVTKTLPSKPLILSASEAVNAKGALPWPDTVIPGTVVVPDRPLTPWNYTERVQESVGEFLDTSGPSVIHLTKGEVVEIVLQNARALNGVAEMHSWHLHGHKFYVVGSGFGTFNESTDPLNYNLINPIKRDSASVLPLGWTALRFKANNPGTWNFHCTQPSHMVMGMGFTFVTSPDLLDAPPPGVSSCLMTSLNPDDVSGAALPTNETATSLAYVFGALFVAALLALAIVLFVYVPKLRKEIRNDGRMKYLTDNETGHGTGLEVSSDNDTTHGV